MTIPFKIISRQPIIVQKLFIYWSEYMNQNIHFSLEDSDIHSKIHCERVLMNALLIGQKIYGNSIQELKHQAHAAIFHNSCRLDDDLDTGHGARAAQYYALFCEKHDIEFSKAAYYCMKYHDRDDELGIESINKHLGSEADNATILYKIFKDADALDRFRFGIRSEERRVGKEC